MLIRRVFVSSTVADLHKERRLVRTTLSTFPPDRNIAFQTYLSEFPDFPRSPTELRLKSAVDVCIDRLFQTDYYVLLLKRRYGAPIVPTSAGNISPTHHEYRVAESRRLPLIVFVDNRLKRAFARHRRGLSQSFVPPSQEALFALYREASENVRTNWITFYSRLDDLRAAISTTLFDFDDSAFVTETIPDGTRVRPDTTFVKTWTIRNQGMVPWVDRFLAEVNSGASGLVPSLTRIPIPPTEPGVEAVLSVTFTTPTLPAIVESYWKMFHADGRLVWPDEIKSGIWCRVVVTLPGR